MLPSCPAVRRLQRPRRAAILALALALAGCAAPVEAPRRLDAAAQQAGWLALDPDDPALRPVLEAAGVETGRWPLEAWGPEALAALAVHRSPALAAARARLAAARALADGAGRRDDLSLGLGLEHHREPGARDTPWALQLALAGLPLGRSGAARRAAGAEQAQAEAQAAALALAGEAWALRQRVRADHQRWAGAEARAALAARRATLLGEQADRLDRQVRAGALDRPSARAAALRHGEAAAASAARRAEAEQAGLALAASLGLPPERWARLPAQAVLPADPPPDPAALERLALLNRLDLREALALHQAAEARLRAEVARQWPEFRLAPGVGWDQGDRVGALGLAISLPEPVRQRARVAEAAARLDEAAARALQRQAEAVDRLARARAGLEAADAARVRAEARLQEAEAHEARQAGRWQAGRLDRLVHDAARLETMDRAAEALEARAAQAAAQAALEDALQHPLAARFLPTAALARPRR